MTRRPNLTREDVERIVELREHGLSPRRIAQLVGCSQGSIGWALLREGAEPPGGELRRLPPIPMLACPYWRGGKMVRPFDWAEDRQLLALEAQGLSACAIARALGRGANSITGRLRTLARHEARAEARAAQQVRRA